MPSFENSSCFRAITRRVKKREFFLLVIFHCLFFLEVTAQSPAITSFAPASGPVGTTVTITGSGFSSTAANNIVYFGAVRASVLTSSPTSLTAVVPAGATYQPITVTTGNLTAYSGQPFIVTFLSNVGGFTANSFAAKADYTTGSNPYSMAIGDMDNDGKPELAVVNFGSGTVSVFKNASTSGAVSLATKADFVTGNSPSDIAIGDIDGDGRLDLAVTNYGSGTVSVLRNTSTGSNISFAAKVDYITGSSPYSIAIGDVDGDGRPDLAVANYGSGTVSVLRNTSTGSNISFAAKVDYITGSSPYSIAIGDVDGDGRPDLAVANYGSGTVSVLRNTSTGGNISFAAKVDYATGSGTFSVAMGDMDADGKADLAVGNISSGTVSVLRNLSTGGAISFAAKVDLPPGATPYGVAIGDADGDGKPDLAIANYNSNTVSVLKNGSTTGTISFAAKTDYTTAAGSISVAMGDIDGDGYPDLLTANYGSNSISVLRSQAGAPGITSFTPTSGGAGTVITIKGFKFTGATAVSIGGIAATSFTVVSDTVITAVVGSVTGGNVTVITPKGTATLGGFYNGPAVISFSPVSGPVGTTVTITGNNFSATPAANIVYFGAVKAAVSAASATSLTVTVPAGTTYQPLTVTVGNLTAYARKPFVVTFSSNTAGITDNSFTPKTDVGSGTNPQSVAIGDMDGDGKPDVAVANPGSGTVSVFRNTGSNGTVAFAVKADYATGSYPSGIAIGDVDGDGKPDLAVTNSNSNTVSVFRNTSISGTVSFAAKADFPTSNYPSGIAIGDVDGDGKPDLAVANSSSNTVSVLRNTGSAGAVSFADKADFPAGSYPYGIAIGDIAGDGKADMAVVNYSANTVSVLRNTGSSGVVTFASKIDYSTGSAPYSVAIGDLDGDSKADLAVANLNSSTLSVFRNTGSSGLVAFASKVDYATGTNPYSIAIGDIDGDGKPDLATANYGSSTVAVLGNTGSSGTVSFATRADYATGSNPYSVAIGDVDGDGRPDLAAANYNSNTVSIFRNQTGAPYIISFAPSAASIGTAVTIKGRSFTGATAVSFGGIGAASFTVLSDTVITAVVAAVAGGGVAVTTPMGTGTLGGFYNGPVITSFSPVRGPVGTTVTITGSNFGSTASDNIVYFGAVKAVVSTASATSLTVVVPAGATYQPLTVTTSNLTTYAGKPFVVTFPSNGGGFTDNSFTPKTDFATGSSPRSVAAGDFDGDGKTDMAVINGSGNTISIFRNTGTGGTAAFATKVDYPTGSNPYSITAGDIDRDGKPDLAVANYSSGTVSIFRNTSTGGVLSFTLKIDFTTGGSPYHIAIGDVDKDGKPDLAITNLSSATVSILRNTTTGSTVSFAARVDYPTGSNPYSVAIGDVDGDNMPDLAVANASSATVSVLRNTGTSGVVSFAAKADFTVGTSPQSVAIGDVDGDGKADLAVANVSSNTVSIVRNTSTSGAVSFAARVDYNTGTNPQSVAIGDVDGDGKPDLAIVNSTSNTVSIFKNNCTSGVVSFSAKADYLTGLAPYYITIGDMDGDGKPDLAVANNSANTVSVLRNQTDGPYIAAFIPSNGGIGTTVTITGTYFTGATAVSFGGIAAASFTVVSDTVITAVVAAMAGGSVAVTTPMGTGTLGGFYNGPVITSFSPARGPIGTTVTITGSNFGSTASDNIVYFGAVKAVVSTASATSLTVVVPAGATYQPLTVTTSNLTTYAGKPFVVSFPSNGLGFNANSFTNKVDFTAGSNPYSIAMGDIDGDGKSDLAVANLSSNTVSVFKNTGAGGNVSFATKVDYPTGSSPYSVAIGDIDGDGKPDMAVANYNAATVSVLRNTSTGGTITFAAKADFTTGSGNIYVAIGDIDKDGKPDLAVANSNLNTVSILRNTSSGGTISFASKTEYTTGSGPRSVVIGDIDGDGKADLAVANGSSNTISIFRNTGTSGTVSFAAKADYLTGSNPYGVAIGDVDNDGRPDLAVANYSSNTVSIFRNTGAAGSVSFAAKTDFVTGSNPYGIAISDLNGDGNPDLAVSNVNANSISIFRNTGSSGLVSFAAKADYTTGPNPYSVALGDVDGDGIPDVVAPNYGSSNVSVLRNQANGPYIVSFSPANGAVGTTITINGANFTGTTQVSIGGIAATSFTVVSDTLITAIIGGIAGGSVAVTTTMGTGTLGGFYNGPVINTVTPASGSVGTTVFITGKNFSPAISGNTVYFGAVRAEVLGAAKDSITVIVPAGTTYKPVTVTTSNLTAYASQPFIVTFPSNAAGFTANSFAGKADYTTGTSPYYVAIGDLDGDGKTDLAVANYSSNTVSVFRNTGIGGIVSFAAKVDYPTGSGPYSVAIGDVDGDGKPDLAISNANSNTASIIRNMSTAGTLSFAAKIDYPTGSFPYSIAIGDLDKDGKPDLAVANYSSASISFFRNTGTSGSVSFAALADYPLGTNPYHVAIGDINGDGMPELAVTNYNSNTVSVLRNTGISGVIAFAAKVDYSTGSGPYHVAIGDADGDGKPDLAITNNGSATVSVLRNTGTGSAVSFAGRIDYATGSNPYSVAISDLNGDGKPDLAIANRSSNTVSLLRNTSIGGVVSFAAKVDYTTGTTPQSVALGDLNGDGKPDLAVVNAGSTTVSVIRNQADGPYISSFAPANAAIGATVTIKGSNFTGATAVSFGGVAATGFVVVSDTVITAVVAAVAGGNVSVTNPEGTGTLSGFYNGPVITSFSPASGPIGTTVAITGSNFSATASGNIVYFGAVKAVVSTATTTSLTVTVPAGATYQPITVTATNLTAYAGKPFVVTFPSNYSGFSANSFTDRADYAAGSNPYSVAIGDVNGDGKPDLAVANSSSSTVSILTNTSTGGVVSYAAKVDFATGSYPYSVAIGDVDGDGKPDLAVTNYYDNTVSVLRNTSSGGNLSFAAKTDYATGSYPQSVAIGDLDGDGRPDLAVANINAYTISVLRNTGAAGALSFAAKADYATSSYPYGIAIGDVNGDGKTDLAVTNYYSNSVSIFMNTSISGVITLAAKVDYATGNSPQSVAIGDMDGDGKADLAVANANANTVSVLKNTGSGGTVSFAAKVDYSSGANPQSVAISDVDGDGKPDLAIANYNANTISLLKNTSTGGSVLFAAKVDYAIGTNPQSIAVGDLSGDGKPDLAVANSGSGTLSILTNQIDAPRISAFTPVNGAIGAAVTITGNNFTGATAVSFGGIAATSFVVVSDSVITAVVGAITGGGVAVTTPKGVGTLGGFYNGPVIDSITPTGGPVGTIVTVSGRNFSSTATGNIVYFGAVRAGVLSATADLLKVIVPGGATYQPVTVTTSNLTAYAGKPFITTFPFNTTGFTANSFAVKADFAAGITPYSVASGDMDGDGKPDLAVVNYSDNTVSVFRNTGVGGVVSYAAKIDYATGSTPRCVAISDLNGDGKLDLVVANSGSATVSVLRNTSTTGTLSFTAKTDYATGNAPFSVAAGDVDGDGKPDLVTANYNSASVSLLINTGANGSISFAARADHVTGSNPYHVAIGDVDGDKKPDLAVANTGSNTISLLRNTLAGGVLSFAPKVDFTTGSSPRILAIGDLDGDNKADIAVANYSSNTVSIFRNTGTSGIVSFAAKADYITAVSPHGIAITDIDGDEKPDLAVANLGSNVISVLRNTCTTGNVSFADKADYGTGSSPYSVAIGDVNEDGKPDLVVANGSSYTVSVLRNQISTNTISVGNAIAINTCAGNPLDIPFTVDSVLNANNVFTAQLSNSSGSFANPVAIGTLTGNSSATINGTIPSNTALGTGYRVRVVSSSPVVTSVPNTNNITINRTPGSDFTINGNLLICAGPQTYTVTGATGLNNRYNWSLSGGGVLDTTTSNAIVNWTTPGTYTLNLTISNTCGSSQTKTVQVTVNTNPLTGTFPNMLPADGNTNLSLPVTFSWFPIANAVSYDLYIWLETGSRPAVPTAANLTSINYTISSSSILQYEKTYKWQVVAKNSCYELPSPVQTFRLRYLPDVFVSSITPATTGFSGQPFSINWQVKNIGSGGTLQGQWYDRVYLSADAILDLNTDIYLGVLPNVSELTPNASYSQTASFVLPNGINNNYYVFVITNAYNGLLESEYGNNTSVSTSAVAIQLTPPPDLRVTSIVPPNFVFSGQDLTFTWKVSNLGTGPTRTTTWYDDVYLSKDTALNLATAISLGYAIHTGALNADSSYTTLKTATLPDGVFGKYYLYVRTDVGNSVYEHAGENNNTARSDSISILLTPPVDLAVTQVTAAVTTASNRETISVQWRVENAGGSSTDNRYWIDNVYLSKDSAFNSSSAILVSSAGRPAALAPGDGYNMQSNIAIPATITGNYFMYVVTDAYNQVYEYNLESNNTRRSSAAIQILSPDLIVENIRVPAGDTSGREVEVKWRIKNNAAAKLFNTAVTDRILISASPVFNVAASTELKRLDYNTGDVAAGDTLGKTTPVKLPDGISGNYYIYIQTDYNNTVFEAGKDTNNTSRSMAPILVTLGPWPDLQVSNVQVTNDSAIAGATVPVTFKIINKGIKPLNNATWSDKLYISNLPQWDSAGAVFLKEFIQSAVLAKDSFYTVNTTIAVPPQLAAGTYYVYVVTDAKNEIFEHTDENNNTGKSNGLYIKSYPPVDIVATSFTAPDSTSSGASITVAWAAQNRSIAATIPGQWADGLYLSADTVWNSNDDVLVKEFAHTGVLQAMQSYTNQQTAVMPNNIAGNFYLLLVTDNANVNKDVNRRNNYILMRQGGTGTPVITRIGLTPPSDLIVTNYTVPFSGQAGQPLTIKWKVKNNGVGVTNAKPWTDKIYLSADPVIDGGDAVVGSFARQDSLLAGDAYEDSLQVFLPISAQGNYFMLLKTDANNNVYEHTGENNNTASAVITVSKAAISDLVVSEIMVPDSAVAGENVTLQWKVKNIGQFPASGYLKNAMYLSEDTVRDVADLLLVSQEATINIAPQTEAAFSYTGELKGASLKNYHVLVYADVLNNIYESSDSNNLSHSVGKMAVTVPLLPLNTLTQKSLPDNKELYYRIEIPDSLAGQTLLITLKGDSVNGANEMYVRHSQVPTRAVYDFSHSLPYEGNQEIVIPALRAGTYYLLATGSTTAGNIQQIRLLAKILNFEIRSVDANRGGNTGPVTVLVSGSKLGTVTSFYLRNAGRSIEAYRIKIIDPTKVYATFNLQDAVLGQYNVVAKNSNGDSATLVNGFTIVAGTAANLITNVVTPPSTRPSTIISITVQYTNAGNTDLVNPVLKLSSLGGAPIGFSVADLANPVTELTLTLSELNGPVGILRPGASGTVIVYAKATTALGFMLLNSK